MAIFLDTGVLFALFSQNDQEHGLAKNLMSRVFKRDYGQAYTSDYVIDEATTLVFARSKNREKSVQFLESCLDSRTLFEIINVTEDDFEETAKEFEKQETLSFTDCSHLVLMRRKGIVNLATFDAGFGNIPRIRTIVE